MASQPLAFTVNGQAQTVLVDPRQALLDVLRGQLGLPGAHRGCDAGDCGACTVLLDGQPVTACLVLALDCQDAQVLTVEAVAQGPVLHKVQRALVEKGGIQCGFCTPGMVMATIALLGENPNPTEPEVRRALAGNLCRCTGYQKIVEAVLAAAEEAA
ncbi:MAG: (2Fe-2S)-binding protein [Anaerolineales bacterium]|nr:(2Fe-2S)-binding protein [Anaerolineales bacterium]